MANHEAGVTVSYLVTREDYADFKAAACRAGFSKKDVSLIRVLGGILAALGMALWMLAVLQDQGPAYTTLPAITVLLGVLMFFFVDLFMPWFSRRGAVAYFDTHKEQMIAQTMVFYTDRMEVRTDRYEASLPYPMLYRVYEDSRVFVFYTGLYEMRFLPKRALSEEELKQIQALVLPIAI